MNVYPDEWRYRIVGQIPGKQLEDGRHVPGFDVESHVGPDLDWAREALEVMIEQYPDPGVMLRLERTRDHWEHVSRTATS